MANYTPCITMIDLEGLDFIAKNNSAVPGLYSKLNSHLSSHNSTIYNFLLADIQMPPSLVELVALNNTITINSYIVVHQNDVISFTGWAGPVIQYLNPIENGEYIAPAGVDGYNPVLVNVPQVPPVIRPLAVYENGNYQVPYGVDGFAPVSVNVPAPPSIYVDPVYTGRSYCYLSSTTLYSYSNDDRNYSYYNLSPGNYYCFVPNSADRNRVSFFPGKDYADVQPYVEQLTTPGSSVLTGQSLYGSDANTYRTYVSIATSGLLVVGITSAYDASAVSYLIKSL